MLTKDLQSQIDWLVKKGDEFAKDRNTTELDKIVDALVEAVIGNKEAEGYLVVSHFGYDDWVDWVLECVVAESE